MGFLQADRVAYTAHVLHLLTLVQNGTAGDNGTAAGTLNQLVLGTMNPPLGVILSYKIIRCTSLRAEPCEGRGVARTLL